MAGFPTLGSVAGGMADQTLAMQDIMLNNYRLKEAPIELQKNQIELEKDKISLQQQVTMLSKMQQLKPPREADTPDSLAGVLSQVAEIQLEAGLPDAAAKTAGEASKLLENSSKIDARAYKMQTERMSKFANILSGVPDTPQGYSLALQTMVASDPGVAKDPGFQKLMQQPWRPGMVAKLQQAVVTRKEQAEIDYRGKAAEHAQAAAVVDQHRVALIDAQKKLAEDRDKHIDKEGGSVVKADDRKAIYDQIMRDYPGADPSDASVRARPLAEEMVKMMREQHLTQSQAAVRVYENARSAGAFGGIRQAPVTPGSKPGVPLPLPPDLVVKNKGASLELQKKEAGKKLQQNQWYMIQGKPRLFMGDQFFSEEELDQIDKEDEVEDEQEDEEE